MAAEVFAVGELGNCPFRGGDREGQRQCEGPTCMCWCWDTENTDGYCGLAGIPAALWITPLKEVI